jgi:hypothetical protein
MNKLNISLGERVSRKIYRRASRDAKDDRGASSGLVQNNLGDGDFFVGAEDGTHSFTNFPERGVGFHSIKDERH